MTLNCRFERCKCSFVLISRNSEVNGMLELLLQLMRIGYADIMHQHAQLADLVDVLAVDFDIVDRLGDSRKGDAQNDRKSIEALQGLTVG